jgi:hypothetical protein
MSLKRNNNATYFAASSLRHFIFYPLFFLLNRLTTYKCLHTERATNAAQMVKGNIALVTAAVEGTLVGAGYRNGRPLEKGLIPHSGQYM